MVRAVAPARRRQRRLSSSLETRTVQRRVIPSGLVCGWVVRCRREATGRRQDRFQFGLRQRVVPGLSGDVRLR